MNPDEQASRDRAWYASKADSLVGRTIVEVTYWDVHGLTDEPRTWDYGDWHQAVMGVDLMTDGGPFCVLWTDTFFPYGAEVFPTRASEHLADRDERLQSWSASGSHRWRERLRLQVQNVETFWERLTIGPACVGGVRVADPDEVDVPVALRLDSAAGPVWMVAGIPEWPEMRQVFVPGDEIMIVFTADRMRQIGFPDSEFLRVSRG